MTKEQIQQIEEGNILIAEFVCGWKPGELFTWPSGGRGWANEKDFKYHTSWDWLMPVVEKISTIQFTDESWIGSEPYQNYAWPRTFGMRDEEGNYMVRFNASPLHTASTLIEAVWLAVVDFIKWDNQQNLNNG
jgi:hypothetical protein